MKSAAIISLLFTFFGYSLDLTPNVPVLLVSVIIGMGIDFITGVIKAKFKKQERTSEGYRRTVKKVTQYFTAIGLCLGIQYLIKQTVSNASTGNLQYMSLFVFVFIIYIEITSILENLNEIDNRSLLSRFFIRPLLAILKFGLEKNPLIKAKDEITKPEDKITAEAIQNSLSKDKTGTDVMPVLLAAVLLLSGCMTDKKMGRITAEYNKKHPELQAKDCMEKFPPKTGTVKTGTEQLFKVEKVKDTAGEKALQEKIEKLTNDLIAEKISKTGGATPGEIADAIKTALATVTPHLTSTNTERHYYTRTDTLPVADSAAIYWWKNKYEGEHDRYVTMEASRDNWKETAADRKKHIVKLYCILGLIVLIVVVYILRRLKVF